MKHACLLPLIGCILLWSAAPQAQAASKATPQQAPALLTREFKTPLNFLASEVIGKASPNESVHKTAQEMLAAQGVLFPEGASAAFNRANNLLVVRNTEDNLEVVDSLVEEAAARTPHTVIIQTTVLEGPGKLIRAVNAAAAKKMNACKEFESLLAQAKQADSRVRVVGDAWLNTRSGLRSITETVREHLSTSLVSLDAKSRSSVEIEMRPIGLRLDLEAYFGNANGVITLTTGLNLFPTPPQVRAVSVSDPMSGNAAEFPVSDVRSVTFSTGLDLMSGDTRILGITKPVGKASAENEDVLWVAFITASVVPVESPKTAAVPPAPAPPKQLPPDKNAKPAKHMPDLLPPDGGVGDFDFDPARPLTTFTTLHTVQASAPFLRALAAKAATTADHAAIWQEIEAAAARGEVSFIDSHVLESQSGEKAEISAARECVYPASFKTNAMGQPDLTFKMRPMGSRLSVEPSISQDEHTVSMDLDYELQTAPPHLHHEEFRDPGSKQKFEIPLLDFHIAHLHTGLTLASGSTRLLTLWKPAGHDDADILWATFLHADVVRQTATPSTPPAAATGSTAPSNENEWITRVFSVPADIANGKSTARQFLEAAGVAFPPGAKAYFNAEASKLIVRNQRQQVDLAESYLVTACYFTIPRPMAFTTHIIQAPGAMIRRVMKEAAGRCDHRPQLAQVLASPEVKHLGTSHIEAKSGQRATSEETIEHVALSAISIDEHGLTFERETRNAGFSQALEVIIQNDGTTAAVALTPEFHTAEPQEHRELILDTQGRRLEFPLTDYHAAKINACIIIPSGTARLLGVWRPTGKPEFETQDILQTMFITCDLSR